MPAQRRRCPQPFELLRAESGTLLIVGSTFPYIEYYPRPDQTRGVQIDVDATRIGLRFPVEVGWRHSAFEPCHLRRCSAVNGV